MKVKLKKTIITKMKKYVCWNTKISKTKTITNINWTQIEIFSKKKKKNAHKKIA